MADVLDATVAAPPPRFITPRLVSWAVATCARTRASPSVAFEGQSPPLGPLLGSHGCSASRWGSCVLLACMWMFALLFNLGSFGRAAVFFVEGRAIEAYRASLSPPPTIHQRLRWSTSIRGNDCTNRPNNQSPWYLVGPCFIYVLEPLHGLLRRSVRLRSLIHQADPPAMSELWLPISPMDLNTQSVPLHWRRFLDAGTQKPASVLCRPVSLCHNS